MNRKNKIQTIVSLSSIVGLLAIAGVATGLNTSNTKLGVAETNTYTATLDGSTVWKDLTGGQSYTSKATTTFVLKDAQSASHTFEATIAIGTGSYGVNYGEGNEAFHAGLTAGVSSNAMVLTIGVKGISSCTITNGTGMSVTDNRMVLYENTDNSVTPLALSSTADGAITTYSVATGKTASKIAFSLGSTLSTSVASTLSFKSISFTWTC